MKFKIFQINLKRDKNYVAFEAYYLLPRLQGTEKVDASIYDLVYEGVDDFAESLEELTNSFDLIAPDGYNGRALTVSDVIQIVEASNIKPGFYYRDRAGFKEIEFDAFLCEKTI